MSHSYPSDISREQFVRILRRWSRPDAGPRPAPWTYMTFSAAYCTS